ncbi:hypothetical protein ABRP77_07830 [Pectobacterium odoriferum]|uniref:hypothetical protein n=1 Tax=Pectobacterium odoriferum TaxID=78398 RepID=UPI0032EB81B0
MARSRNIKPGFFTNDELAECSPYARLLFAGLWTIADREGRLDDRPKKVKALVLPFDDVDCNELLQQLHEKKFINRYQVKGDGFIQIANWKKHQNPHCKEAPSEIPEQCSNDESSEDEQEEHSESTVQEAINKQQVVEIDEALDRYSASTVQASDEHTTNPADSLNLIPDSLIPHPDSVINTQAADASCDADGEELEEAEIHNMAGRYAFEGNIIRLNHKDYEAWKLLYPNIDLHTELQRLDIEFTHDTPKKWFITASQKLNYQNKQAEIRKPAPQRRYATENFAAKNYGSTETPSWLEG